MIDPEQADRRQRPFRLGQVVAPNGELIQGQDSIRASWSGGLQMGTKDAVLKTVDVLGLGDIVCEIGR